MYNILCTCGLYKPAFSQIEASMFAAILTLMIAFAMSLIEPEITYRFDGILPLSIGPTLHA